MVPTVCCIRNGSPEVGLEFDFGIPLHANWGDTRSLVLSSLSVDHPFLHEL